jgi:hypothetical protein
VYLCVFVVVHVYGVRLCLRTAATNEPIVHPQVTCEFRESRWNDIDRGNPKISEKILFQYYFVHHNRARIQASAVGGQQLTA